MSENPQLFVDALLQEVSTTHYDLLFPTFEETFLVSRFRDLFSKYTNVLVSDYNLFMKLHHKGSLTRMAKDLGIPVPPTWQPENIVELERLAGEVPFPAIIKLPDVNNSLGLTVVESKKQLVQKYKSLVKFFRLSKDRMPLIQKAIEGDLLFSLFLANHGETVGTLIYKPLRMFPEGGGTAFYRESIRNNIAEKSGMKLIEKIRWHGFIGFDFILDPQTQEPCLIDANPRTSPAFQTGEVAGVDFTQMAIDLCRDKKPKSNLQPTEGVRSKTLFVEIIWFVFQFLPGKNWSKRIKTALSVFKKRYFNPDVHRSDDPWPSLVLYFYVNYFLFIINPIKPRTGGFCFGCNYNLDTASRIDVKVLEKKYSVADPGEGDDGA